MKFEQVISGTRCAAVALGVVILYPIAAKACSWPEGYRLTEAAIIDRFCEADAVFVGEVESSLNTRNQIVEYKIWPRRIHRGQISSPAYALDARQIEEPKQRFCGFRFKPMGRYLIFADQYKDLNYLCVSTCDLSQSFNPDNFVYQVVTSIDNVEEECGEEASRKRQVERRQYWIRRYSGENPKIEELEEAARQLREARESSAAEP